MQLLMAQRYTLDILMSRMCWYSIWEVISGTNIGGTWCECYECACNDPTRP